MLTISKFSTSSLYFAFVRIGNTLVTFKTNQEALLSNECPTIFCSWPNWKEKEDHFGGCKKGGHIVRLPRRALVCRKRWEKMCPFVKFEIILPPLCCLLDAHTNKHCRAWTSMINLWIDSRTFQKYRTLFSARQRPNNYLELSKENVLGNMMLPHWPCFIWKFWYGFTKSLN